MTGIFLFRLDSYPDHHLLPLFIHSLIPGPSFINRIFLEGLFLDALASLKTMLDIEGRFHEKKVQDVPKKVYNKLDRGRKKHLVSRRNAEEITNRFL